VFLVGGEVLIGFKKKRPSEEDAKLRVGKWLEGFGCRIYDEKRSKLKEGWGHFEIQGEDKSPDLLVEGLLYSKSRVVGQAYIALEIKVGWKHQEIVQGFDQVLSYFVDYCWGAQYLVEDKPIEVFAIVLATYYSPDGYIYRFEKGLPYNFIPAWPASPLVATLSRVMWTIRNRIEKTFQEMIIAPNAEKIVKGAISLRRQPLVGILAKNVRKSNQLPYKAELLLSRPDWSWGITGL